MTVMEVFEKNITAYDDNEPVMIRHGDIVRILPRIRMFIFSQKRDSTGSGSGYMSWRNYWIRTALSGYPIRNRECKENNQAGHKHYRNNQDVHEGRYTDLCIQKICKQDKEDIKIIKTAYI